MHQNTYKETRIKGVLMQEVRGIELFLAK